jgi:hypothetical protein
VALSDAGRGVQLTPDEKHVIDSVRSFSASDPTVDLAAVVEKMELRLREFR